MGGDRVGDLVGDPGTEGEGPAPGGQPVGHDRRDLPVPGSLGRHEQRLWDGPGGQPAGDHLDPLGHEGAFGPAGGALLKQPAQTADPLVRVAELLAQEAATSAPVPGAFAEATATSAPKASESVTARSARILRSTSTPARCRPAISWL